MSINSFLEKLKQRVSPTPVDETGMWYQDKDVVVPSNKITMKGPEGEDDYFDEPIVGTGMQSGKSVVMQPGEDYEFPDDDSVYESKQMQKGALTYTPYSKPQNQYTDSPTPRPIIKPRVGDTINPNYEKLYTNLALDAGSLLPKPYGGVLFNVASKLSAAEDDDYSQGLEFVPGKEASSLSVVNDIYKISQAKPYKYQGKKQLGGNIDNISPEGDVNFSLGNKNKLAFNVRGSSNIPNFKLNSVSPNLSYNNKGFSADVSPNSFGAGYNNSKVNLNANATVRNNAVESAGIQGSYNVTPNLSLTGNYNINKGEQGTDKNYFAGFRYSKSFEEGGELPPIYTSNPNDPRIRSYKDSLSLYKDYTNPIEISKIFKKIKSDPALRYYRSRSAEELNNFPGKIKPISGTEWNYSKLLSDFNSGKNIAYSYYPFYDERGVLSPTKRGTHLSFKKPVQPYIYKKPEVVPEVVETPLPVAPIDQPVKKIGYNKPIIQQFNYMSNENKAKALQKYGSVSDIPFQGVDINQLKDGGMSIPGVNGTVIASDNSPRLKKAYMQKAGYVKYVPPSQRPLTFQSSNPSTADNARITPSVNSSKPIIKPIAKPVVNEDADFKKVVLEKMRDLEKVNSVEKYQKQLDNLRAKEKANPSVDYSLVVDKPYMDLNDPEQVKTLYEEPSVVSEALDVLPTNLSFFARGILGMDNSTGNLSDQHLKELGYAINKGMKRKQTPAYGFDGSFGYDDYRNGRSDYNDAANNNRVLTTTEVADLQTSIGQAKYKVLPNGDVVVADNYNFDEYAKSPKNIYQAGEVLGAKMGVNTQTYVVVPKDYIKDVPAGIPDKKPEKTSLRDKYAETKTVTPKQTKAVYTPIAKSTSKVTSKSSTGDSAVRNYQKMLNSKYNAGLETDGAWGPKTQAAYEKYIKK